MKYLLIIMLACYGLTFWAYSAANRSGDDFGAALPALVGIVLSIALTIIYILFALWNHRFW